MKKFLFGLILGGLLVFGHFFVKENPDNSIVIQSKNLINKILKKQSTIGLANPASAYCIEQNGQLSIQNGEDGQIGICVFPDGSCCEEWEFFRGECQKSTQYCNDFGSIITNNKETNADENIEIDKENSEDIDENLNSEDNELNQTDEYEETKPTGNEEIIEIEDDEKTESIENTQIESEEKSDEPEYNKDNEENDDEEKNSNSEI